MKSDLFELGEELNCGEIWPNQISISEIPEKILLASKTNAIEKFSIEKKNGTVSLRVRYQD